MASAKRKPAELELVQTRISRQEAATLRTIAEGSSRSLAGQLRVIIRDYLASEEGRRRIAEKRRSR